MHASVPRLQPIRSSLGFTGRFPWGLSASTYCPGLGLASPQSFAPLPLQILLNYLPVERAAWTSILAKQR